ncbi:MAG: hypothetical protein H6953_05890 [Chromatiaceae bacterium]|nr:hypothetical protein [Chromatiaceae bacterium]MCP5314915.1 hypothetical protein [Chromatiaceae bacterium]
MTPRGKKLAIAIVGCTLAVISAIVGGVQRVEVDAQLQTVRAQLASNVAEVSRRDRQFDVANASRLAWEQSRIALRVLCASSGQLYGPAIESIESQIYDTLSWGNEAAYGKPLTTRAMANLDKAARIIASDEARRSRQIKAPAQADTPPNESELGEAVSLVQSIRQEQLDSFWNSRQKLVDQQAEMRKSETVLDGSLRRIDSIVLSLQIAGLLIVLLKDFVPEAKPTPGDA